MKHRQPLYANNPLGNLCRNTCTTSLYGSDILSTSMILKIEKSNYEQQYCSNLYLNRPYDVYRKQNWTKLVKMATNYHIKIKAQDVNHRISTMCSYIPKHFLVISSLLQEEKTCLHCYEIAKAMNVCKLGKSEEKSDNSTQIIPPWKLCDTFSFILLATYDLCEFTVNHSHKIDWHDFLYDCCQDWSMFHIHHPLQAVARF